MIKPSYDEVLNLKDNYSVIPIYKEIYADAFTPINLLRKIAGKSDKFFLLESIEGGEKWARYSFIGFNPKARLSYKNGTLTVTGEGQELLKQQSRMTLSVSILTITKLRISKTFRRSQAVLSATSATQ